MGSSDDPRVKAAKAWLELLLDEVFENTSTACRKRLEELDDPPVIGDGIFGGVGTDGDYVVRDFIELWKEQLTGSIRKVFESSCRGQEPQGDENHPGDIAKLLTWEVIDQEFQWTPDDRSNSTRFKEWLSRAAYPEPAHLLEACGLLPHESVWQAGTAEKLSRDFPVLFENLLNKLKLEAFVNAPTAQSTKPAESSDSNANGMQSGLVHSNDYRVVIVSDKQYTLTPNAALIIGALDKASAKGIPALSTAELRKSIGGPQSRIKDSFRSGDGRKFWEEFVVQTAKGMYALKLPPRH